MTVPLIIAAIFMAVIICWLTRSRRKEAHHLDVSRACTSLHRNLENARKTLGAFSPRFPSSVAADPFSRKAWPSLTFLPCEEHLVGLVSRQGAAHFIPPLAMRFSIFT